LADVDRQIPLGLGRRIEDLCAQLLRRVAYIAVTAFFLPVITINLVLILGPGGLVLGVYGELALLFATYAAQAVFVLRGRARMSPILVALELLNVIACVGKEPDSKRSLLERRQVAQRLERLARQQQSIGALLKSGDELSAVAIDDWVRRLAARTRQFKISVLWPRACALKAFQDDIASDLLLVLQDQWEELPIGDPLPPSTPPSRLNRLGWAFLSLLLVGLAVAAIRYSTELGPAGPILVSILGASGLLAVTNAGLPLQGFTDAKAAFDSLRKGP
jgi:hypothetical protein